MKQLAKKISLRQTLLELVPGEAVVVEAYNPESVRATACSLGVVGGRKYRTKLDRQKATITVTRIR